MKKIPLWIWGAAAIGGLWYLSRPKTTTALGAGGSVAAGAQSVSGTTNAGHIAGAPHIGYRAPGHELGAGRPHGGGGHGHHGHARGRGVPWGGFAGVDYATDVYIQSCGCADLPALQNACTRAPGKIA